MALPCELAKGRTESHCRGVQCTSSVRSAPAARLAAHLVPAHLAAHLVPARLTAHLVPARLAAHLVPARFSSPYLLLSVRPLDLPPSDSVLLQNIDLWPLPKGSTPGSSGRALVGPVTCPALTSRALPHCGCRLFSCLTEEVVQVAFYTWQFKFRSTY